MATIRLQQFGGDLYPVDAISVGVLKESFGIGKIPCDKFYAYSPKIVKKGHCMAIQGNIDLIV